MIFLNTCKSTSKVPRQAIKGLAINNWLFRTCICTGQDGPASSDRFLVSWSRKLKKLSSIYFFFPVLQFPKTNVNFTRLYKKSNGLISLSFYQTFQGGIFSFIAFTVSLFYIDEDYWVVPWNMICLYFYRVSQSNVGCFIITGLFTLKNIYI